MLNPGGKQLSDKTKVAPDALAVKEEAGLELKLAS